GCTADRPGPHPAGGGVPPRERDLRDLAFPGAVRPDDARPHRAQGDARDDHGDGNAPLVAGHEPAPGAAEDPGAAPDALPLRARRSDDGRGGDHRVLRHALLHLVRGRAADLPTFRNRGSAAGSADHVGTGCARDVVGDHLRVFPLESRGGAGGRANRGDRSTQRDSGTGHRAPLSAARMIRRAPGRKAGEADPRGVGLSILSSSGFRYDRRRQKVAIALNGLAVPPSILLITQETMNSHRLWFRASSATSSRYPLSTSGNPRLTWVS